MNPPTTNTNSNTSRKISWDEVYKHNKLDDCWVVVHGKVYDVTKWVPSHPGGRIILNGAGREATALFESYHPEWVHNKLPAFQIGELEKFNPYYTWDKSKFYTTVKQRVAEVIKQEKLNQDSKMMYFKTFLIFLGWFVFYYLSMIKGYTLAAFAFGLIHSHLGISISHDGCHGSYSKNSFLSYLASCTLDLMGGSSLVWCMQHNIGHHPNSNRNGDKNIDEFDQFDPDVRSGFPIMRFNPHQPWAPHHRYQHIYIFLLYSIVGPRWYVSDVRAVLSRKYNAMRFFEIPQEEVYKVMVTKFIFLVYSFIIPAFYLDSFWRILFLDLIWWTVTSYSFCLVFATNHLTDTSEFPSEQTKNRDWAELQVLTTTNYATDSTFWTWLSGALNFQIEHHLFPGIPHTYYPYIAPVVKKTCKEFNLPYSYFPTYWEAMGSYVRHLKNLGNPPDQKIKSQ